MNASALAILPTSHPAMDPAGTLGSPPAASGAGDGTPFGILAGQALEQGAPASDPGQGDAAAHDQTLPPSGSTLPPSAADANAATPLPGFVLPWSQALSGDGALPKVTDGGPESDPIASDAPETVDSDPGAEAGLGMSLQIYRQIPASAEAPAVAEGAASKESDTVGWTLEQSRKVLLGSPARRALTSDQAAPNRHREPGRPEGGDAASPTPALGDESQLSADTGSAIDPPNQVADLLPSMPALVASVTGEPGSDLRVASGAMPSAQTQVVSATGTPATLAGVDAPSGTGNATDPTATQRMSSNTPTVRVPYLLSDPHWPEQFAARVDWLTGSGATDARIAINPPDLGPIDIHITVQDDQARIHFAVQHDAVRDAVQDSLPRLRDMLQQSGLQLANADVSTGRQDQSRPAPDLTMAYAAEDDVTATVDPTAAAIAHLRVGYVDTYI